MNDYLSLKIKNLNLILITMIVLLHSYNISDNQNVMAGIKDVELFFSNGMARLAVPMFFLISGYLFFINFQMNLSAYLNKLLKRINSLVIPYITFSGFCTLILIGLNYLGIRSNNFVINNFTDFINILLVKPIPYHLWFIRDLFIIVLISPIIYFLIKKIRFIYFSLIFLIWLNNYQIYKLIDNETVFFFSLGALLAMIYSKQVLKVFKSKSKSFALFLFFIWIFLLIFKNKTDLLILNNFLHRFSQITGIIVLWIGYDILFPKFSNKKLFRSIFKYNSLAFFLYLTHEPLLTVVKKLLIYFSSSDVFLLLYYFIAPIITIILIVLMSQIIKRIPNVYKILTGNR